MRKIIPLKSGDEQDALTGWRKVLRFRPGERKRVKRGYARRLRKWLDRQMRSELEN